jgi:hypothetical protein
MLSLRNPTQSYAIPTQFYAIIPRNWLKNDIIYAIQVLIKFQWVPIGSKLTRWIPRG